MRPRPWLVGLLLKKMYFQTWDIAYVNSDKVPGDHFTTATIN